MNQLYFSIIIHTFKTSFSILLEPTFKCCDIDIGKKLPASCMDLFADPLRKS